MRERLEKVEQRVEPYRIFRNIYQTLEELQEINKSILLTNALLIELMAKISGLSPDVYREILTKLIPDYRSILERAKIIERKEITREIIEIPYIIQPTVRNVVYALPMPVGLHDATKLTVPTTEPYRYELGRGDIIMIYSPDDDIYFSPKHFQTDSKGAIPIPAGALFIFVRNKAWRFLWLMRATTPGPVYVAEWSYIE